jgi:hypothetical protein
VIAGFIAEILFDAVDAELVPVEFPAVTVKVYDVPSLNPLTVIGDDDAVPVIDPGLDVAVKVVAVPPVAAAVNVTDAARPAAVAVPIVGLSGTSAIGVMPGINVLLFTLAKIVIFYMPIRTN